MAIEEDDDATARGVRARLLRPDEPPGLVVPEEADLVGVRGGEALEGRVRRVVDDDDIFCSGCSRYDIYSVRSFVRRCCSQPVVSVVRIGNRRSSSKSIRRITMMIFFHRRRRHRRAAVADRRGHLCVCLCARTHGR